MYVIFAVSCIGMLSVVPLSPHPLPHVCDLQPAPKGKGSNTYTNHILAKTHHQVNERGPGEVKVLTKPLSNHSVKK